MPTESPAGPVSKPELEAKQQPEEISTTQGLFWLKLMVWLPVTQHQCHQRPESTNSTRDARGNHNLATMVAIRAKFAACSRCFQNQASRTSLTLLTLMWRKRQKAGPYIDWASPQDPPHFNRVYLRRKANECLELSLKNASQDLSAVTSDFRWISAWISHEFLL